MPQTKTLREMDDNEFLAKVDTLMAHLERQVAGDSVGDWAVSAIKDEIRRRVLKPTCSTPKKLSPTPITVEIDKFDLDEIVPFGSFAFQDFNGVPYLIYVSGKKPGESKELLITQGFFSTSEARAYLLGLETARKFGLQFTGIPDIDDIPDPENGGQGTE